MVKYPKENIIEGNIRIDRSATGYITHPEKGFDIHIPAAFLNTALYGDTVRVRIEREEKGIVYGKVVDIVSRFKSRFTGILKTNDGILFVEPDDYRVHKNILIPSAHVGEAQGGQKVVVDITDWQRDNKEPVGRVALVLGAPGNHETEITAIIYNKNFTIHFPKDVEEEAGKARKFLDEPSVKTRRDFRDVSTFTIDPETAKDFDDAISVQELGKGMYEIGIHIADVTHFVRPGTKLDKEGAKRATSIYMVDRTVPMLPEGLSNDLCSLNPNEDKLVFSAVFVMNEKAEIKKEWFGKSIIKSDKRFTYEDAQKVLDSGNGPHAKELKVLERLAQILRAERIKNGSILFEDKEVKVILDKANRPIDIIRKKRIETQKLIEDFMLLANRRVAEFIGKYEKKNKIRHFVYRVHDKPNEEKISYVITLLRSLGYKIKEYENITAQEINQILKSVERKPEEGLIQTALVRTMAKAMYTSKNIGHFGLGFSFYTHFTSPIRRYPDMMVHRLLETYLGGGVLSDKDIEESDRLAAYASQMEKVAEEAERESIKFKQAEYMKDRIGQVFGGIVSGVTSWGIYVEEEKTGSEGLVPIGNLGNDYFIFNKEKFSLVGKQTKKKFQLGDRVRIRVKDAHVLKKQITYSLV